MKMKLHILAVRDTKALVYGQPFCVPNIGAAVRQFGDQVKDPSENNVLHKHPEDFDLYYIGAWLDETGDIDCTQGPDGTAIDKPLMLARGADYSA